MIYRVADILRRLADISFIFSHMNAPGETTIQERKEFGGKIKLENRLTDTSYNYLLKVNIKNTRKIC